MGGAWSGLCRALRDPKGIFWEQSFPRQVMRLFLCLEFAPAAPISPGLLSQETAGAVPSR